MRFARAGCQMSRPSATNGLRARPTLRSRRGSRCTSAQPTLPWRPHRQRPPAQLTPPSANQRFLNHPNQIKPRLERPFRRPARPNATSSTPTFRARRSRLPYHTRPTNTRIRPPVPPGASPLSTTSMLSRVRCLSWAPALIFDTDENRYPSGPPQARPRSSKAAVSLTRRSRHRRRSRPGSFRLKKL